MNIKELKEAIKNLPDDMPIYSSYWESTDDSETSWQVEVQVYGATDGYLSLLELPYGLTESSPLVAKDNKGNIKDKYGFYTVKVLKLN